MIFCVYVDWTLEEIPRAFYVGKGTQARCRIGKRNEIHNRISKKYGRKRQVVLETQDEKQAFALERQLVSEYRTYVHGGEGWWGANLTLGGEGASGNKRSLAVRKKIGRGRRGKLHSEESKLKMSKQRKGRKLSETHRLNVQKASTGRLHSNKTKQKLRKLALEQWKRIREGK